MYPEYNHLNCYQNCSPWCSYIDGLVQSCNISSALTINKRQPSTKPLICEKWNMYLKDNDNFSSCHISWHWNNRVCCNSPQRSQWTAWITYPVLSLMMTWWWQKAGHQQAWYLAWFIRIHIWSSRKNLYFTDCTKSHHSYKLKSANLDSILFFVAILCWWSIIGAIEYFWREECYIFSQVKKNFDFPAVLDYFNHSDQYHIMLIWSFHFSC